MQLSDDLKKFGIRSLPDDYNGQPCTIQVMIVDVAGLCYNSKIEMPNGFIGIHFKKAVQYSFTLCRHYPSVVVAQYFKFKKNVKP